MDLNELLQPQYHGEVDETTFYIFEVSMLPVYYQLSSSDKQTISKKIFRAIKRYDFIPES